MIITIKFLNKKSNKLLFFLLLIVDPRSGFGETPVDNKILMVSTTVAPVHFDTDSDTMPDDWERMFFGQDLTIATREPPSDSDSDGIPDYLEYYCGTDPLDGASRLRITEFSGFNENGEFVVEWTSSTETWDGLLLLSDSKPRSYKVFSGDSVGDLLSIDNFDTVLPPPGSPAVLGEVSANPSDDFTIFIDTEDLSGKERKFYQVILSFPLPPD